MSAITIRPFRRSDRAHLARWVNAHAAAILPGAQLSTQRILALVEDEPEEQITNPWVDARTCLVAESAGTILAAALLVHYADAPQVSDSMRGSASLRWIVGSPEHPAILDELLAAAASWATSSGSRYLGHAGRLPVLGCSGTPAAWPHVAEALDRSGFDGGFDVEVTMGHTPRRSEIPMLLVRSVGICGTRLSLTDDEGLCGYIEVEAADADRSTFSSGAPAFDVGNLWVRDGADGSTRDLLLAAGEDRCARAGAAWLVVYVSAEDAPQGDWLRAQGYAEISRYVRGRTLSCL